MKINYPLAVFALTIVCAYGMFAAPSAVAAENITVNMTSQGFEPKEVTINKGDTVTYVNNDAQYRWPASNIHPTHNIYPEFDPKAEIAPGSSWKFTFDEVGNWKYHDHLVPTMNGTVIVADASAQKCADSESNQKCASTQQKQGSWSKLWHAIANWWRSIWRKKDKTTNKDTEVKSEQVSKPNKQEAYNLNIGKTDESIFTDETALASYMHVYGPKQTIAQLHSLENKFGSCHQPAHRAGHIGYQQLGNHALIEYSPECQSGYYHGVMEAYFKDHGTNNLAESFTTLCPSNLNNFFEHQCVHGIGHGLLAWTNYELPEALTACDQLPRRQDSCWTGVFMENLSAQIANGNINTSIANSDTHLTKYLKNDDPLYPCNGVAEKYQNSCYFLQTSRMLQMFGQDFKKVSDACATAPAIYQTSCFGSMGRDVGGNFPTDNTRQIKECGYVTNPTHRKDCLNGAVQNSFWDPSGQTQAVDFCKRLTDTSEKQGCYNTLFERATQLFATAADKQSFCNLVEAGSKPACIVQVVTQ